MEKKRKKVDGGAAGGQLVRDDGQGWRRERWRRGAAVLVVVVGAEKVKDFCNTAFIGTFKCAIKFILHRLGVCTGGGAVQGDGWRYGRGELVREPGGGAGRRYPHLHLYSWDDKGVWFAEIFFRFSGRLWLCRLAKMLVYVVEFVQIDKEGDGKLFILSFEFKGFKGFKGFNL